MSKAKRYYIEGSIVHIEEDFQHEFKGHRNLSEEEVPPWCLNGTNDSRRTRAPVSRVLNGFLNTGNGGTVYLGILDDGKVKGLKMTQYQKDHLIASLDDLMERYRPPVEKHRYRVKFVPVVEQNCSDDKVIQVTNYDSTKSVSLESRRAPHTLRTYIYCWCDKEAVAQINCGMFAADYVVEITVKPWDPEDPRNKYPVGKMKGHPIHECETGKAFFRRQTTVTNYTLQEVAQLAEETVHNHYQPQIERLQAEVQRLRKASPCK